MERGGENAKRSVQTSFNAASDSRSASRSAIGSGRPASTGRTLYVRIDETGNLGKRERNETHYIMAGCLVNDIRAFEDVVRDYHMGREMKFHDDPAHRVDVLENATPFVDTVAYVQFSKKKHGWTGKEGRNERKLLHRSMLASLIEGVAKETDDQDLDIVIDENIVIPDDEAVNLAEDICRRWDTAAEARVHESVRDYGLQTNDFFVGAIGHSFNHPRMKSKKTAQQMSDESIGFYTRIFSDKMEEYPFRWSQEEPLVTMNSKRRKPGSPHQGREPGHTNVLRPSDAAPQQGGLGRHTNKGKKNCGYKKTISKDDAEGIRRKPGSPHQGREPGHTNVLRPSDAAPQDDGLERPTNGGGNDHGYKKTVRKRAVGHRIGGGERWTSDASSTRHRPFLNGPPPTGSRSS